MIELTFVTPIAPSHAHLFAFAHASVQAQTVACVHLWRIDEDRRGPGWVRNRLLEQVQTPYVSFLDADDYLEPDFSVRMLQVARNRGHYVYSDWFTHGQHIHAPDCAWTNGTHHLVTAVIPTDWIRAVGGFDEQLPALEDTDLYTKLTTRGYPCCRLPIPLVHYRANGGRALAAHTDQRLLDALNAEMHQRYGGKSVSCGCGEVAVVNETPIGQKQDGDVLAQALWGGNREEYGRASGRRYPRMSYPKLTWADPADIRMSPHLWAQVYEPTEDPPPLPLEEPAALVIVGTDIPKGLAALEQQLVLMGLVTVPPLPTAVNQSQSSNPPNLPAKHAGQRARLPNVGKVKRLAAVARGHTDWPIFVMPRKFYPSYVDVWELARLSGFELIYQDEANLADEQQTFIFAAPESIPDCTHARARTILWQLEYGGDYTRQANGDTVSEVWCSDPSYASRTGTKFVLMGSHRGLNPALARCDNEYDVTMLAYMVGRRGEIKERLSDLNWPKNYPGHVGDERHALLARTRLMLHVHQHETPAIAPQRFALAAAYHMPLISETVSDTGVYGNAVMWAEYEAIPARVRQFLGGHVEDDVHYDNALHQLLCIDHPFDQCVFGGLR